MEWNSKSTTEWEWENTAICSGGPIDIDQVLVENESAYLSADLGIGSLSKAYEKKDLDEIGNGFPNKTGEFQFADCSSSGLKLGGGSSNFEEMCGDKKVSLSVIPASSSSSGKRARASYQSVQMPRCQVEGCNLDLTSAKDYHRRHRICESHSKCPKVIVAGLERRFCQQCSRFHDLAEFDEKKRSCRRRLSDHNARRRRQQPEAFHFGSTRLSSLYDQRPPQMNFLLNGVPIRISNKIWERDSGYGGGDSSLLVGHLNDQEFDGSRLIYPNNLMIPTYIPPPPRLLSHRGGETSLGIISTSSSSSNNANYNNGEGAPKEVYHHNRVLSLLSTDSQRPPPLNNNSFQQFNNFPNHHQEQQFTPQYISHPLMNLVDPHPNILSSPDLLQRNINVVVSSDSTQLFYPNSTPQRLT